MRLYYFTTSQFGLEAIRDSRLKISRIHELNDPFEFRGLALRKRADRILMNKFIKIIGNRIGLLCMSSSWHHPLLWAHYADKHRGLCLGFDISQKLFFSPVKYVKERPTLRKFGKTYFNEINEEDLTDKNSMDNVCNTSLPIG